MTLHQPKLTPELQRQHAAHLQRRSAIKKREPLQTLVASIECLPAPVPDAPPAPEDDWVERQRRLWFRMIADLGPVSLAATFVSEIQRATARHYGIDLNDMLSRRKTADVVLPRQVAMYIAKSITRRSLPEIGRRFDGRDHTTVLHAVNKIERLMCSDPELVAAIESIKVSLMEKRA